MERELLGRSRGHGLALLVRVKKQQRFSGIALLDDLSDGLSSTSRAKTERKEKKRKKTLEGEVRAQQQPDVPVVAVFAVARGRPALPQHPLGRRAEHVRTLTGSSLQ